MNFRKLLTYLTVSTAAVIPFAGAQNPTILQGSYISNVFGNSNFVLNPNAQTNIANVTTVTATVARSTTTPLVATSEFTVAIGTANGTATWATRAFDAGMKGQNCEARFSYRGFAATSKVHIKQGANAVASLTLTPATDPRIASINFPCGDLSTATTFQVTDTAILAGTNEIGGIYVGLATNMANVAQAEYIGYGGYANGGTISYWDTSTGESFMTMNNVSTGAVETSSSSIVPEPVVLGNLLRVRFNGLKPGNYHATFTGPLHKDSSTQTGTCSYTITPVTVSGSTVLANEGEVFTYNVTALGQDPNPAGGTLTSNFAVTSTQDVYLYIKVANASSICRASVGTSTGKRMRFHLHRFPSSSELVVTPERQNTFAAASWTGIYSVNRTSTAEITVSSIDFSTNRTAFGKAQFTATANDVAITVPQMPAGTYRVELTASNLGGYSNTVGSLDTGCFFYLKDGSGLVATASSNQFGVRYSQDYVTAATQIVRYTSVADRTFTASLAAKNTNDQFCNVSQPKIIITPLDQPSNSALYVQGPVKAAISNTAIPTDSIGGKVIDASLTKTTTALGTWQVATGNFGTPPAGSYLMMMTSIGNATAGIAGTGSIINENGGSVTPVTCQLNAINSTANGTVIGKVCYYTTDGTKTLYAWAQSTGAFTAVETQLILVRLN